MTTSVRQVLARVVGPAVILAGLLLPGILLSGRVPDSAAIHWGLSGAPNGHGPQWLVTFSLSGLWLLTWGLLARSRGARSLAATANTYAIGGMLVAAHGVGLWANLDRPSWQDARQLPNVALTLLAMVAVAAATGGLGWLLAGADTPAVVDSGGSGLGDDATAVASRPSVRLGPEEVPVWTGSAHNWRMFAVVMIAIPVALFLTGVPLLRLILVLAAAALVFAQVEVTVGPSGVTIRIGLLGWPRRHTPYARIISAEAITAQPLSYGGWGWRRRPGVSAVIIRGGEALCLHLSSGLTFVVTVDGAQQAAGLVNDYLARLRAGR